MATQSGRYSAVGQGGFNQYAAGAKRYGLSGRSMPTVGPVDKGGYRERDARLAARKNALLKQMQAGLGGRHKSADALRPQVRRPF